MEYCELSNFPKYSQDICIDLNKDDHCGWGDILVKKNYTFTRYYENNRKETGEWQIDGNRILLYSSTQCSSFSSCGGCGAKAQLLYELRIEQGNLLFQNKDQEEFPVSCLKSW